MRKMTDRQQTAIEKYFEELNAKNSRTFKYDRSSKKFYRCIDNLNVYVFYSYFQYVGGVAGDHTELIEVNPAGEICKTSQKTGMGSCQKTYADFCNTLIEISNYKI